MIRRSASNSLTRSNVSPTPILGRATSVASHLTPAGSLQISAPGKFLFHATFFLRIDAEHPDLIDLLEKRKRIEDCARRLASSVPANNSTVQTGQLATIVGKHQNRSPALNDNALCSV